MLEDDLIKELKNSRNEVIRNAYEYKPADLIHVLGRNIEWLHHEVRKLLAGHNDSLPAKAKRDVDIVWVLPTRHMNYRNDHFREILSGCIENLVEIHNEHNYALPLKQNWDQYDPSIYFSDSQRYSTEGLNRLWRAFDRTVWYATITIAKQEAKKANEIAQQRAQNQNQRGGFNRASYRGVARGSTGRNYFAKKPYYTKFSKINKKRMPPPPPPNE